MLKELDPLLSQYARSRETLFHCLDRLNEDETRELLPGRDWSVHDTLVHLVTNETLMLDLLCDIVKGTRFELPADFDNQRFNEQQVALGRAKTLAELRAELDANYARMIQLLEQVTPETLHRRGAHPAAGDTDVKEFFLAMYAHHEMHCRDVVEQTRRLKKVS